MIDQAALDYFRPDSVSRALVAALNKPEEDRLIAIRQRIQRMPAISSPYTWWLCWECNEKIEPGDNFQGSFPYTVHINCIQRFDVPEEQILINRADAGKGSFAVTNSRETGVDKWIARFWLDPLSHQDFTVHQVLEWIKGQGGPEFSYAGIRRVLKLKFNPCSRGMFRRWKR